MSNGYAQHFKKMKKTAAQTQPAVKPRPLPINRAAPAKSKKAKKPFPILNMIFATIILGASTWLYANLDQVETWVSKVEIQFLGAAIAQEKNLPNQNENAEKKVPVPTDSQAAETGSERNLTPEELALFNKLEERRVELDQRETDLKKLEEELQQQKVMLEGKMKTLEEMRNNIAAQLDDRVRADETKVEKLVAMYSNMKPQRAAKILETVNEDLAVEVLKNMKRDKAADILNMLDSSKAQKLSEKFAGYRKD